MNLQLIKIGRYYINPDAIAYVKHQHNGSMGHVVAAHPRARNVALQRRTGGAPKT